jgi:hypothetical protein
MRHLQFEYDALSSDRLGNSNVREHRMEGDSYIGNGWSILDSCALAGLLSVIVGLLGAAIFLPMPMGEVLAAAGPALSW